MNQQRVVRRLHAVLNPLGAAFVLPRSTMSTQSAKLIKYLITGYHECRYVIWHPRQRAATFKSARLVIYVLHFLTLSLVDLPHSRIPPLTFAPQLLPEGPESRPGVRQAPP
jgi:hypothetical protein